MLGRVRSVGRLAAHSTARHGVMQVASFRSTTAIRCPDPGAGSTKLTGSAAEKQALTGRCVGVQAEGREPLRLAPVCPRSARRPAVTRVVMTPDAEVAGRTSHA